MNISIFPEEIYLMHLNNIKSTKFTPREIDIIACLSHGKTSKGIANFLSTRNKVIGERAIETHILNIRRKVGGNSRESIVNFIETSGKYQIIRHYYSCLLLRKEFEEYLAELSAALRHLPCSFEVVIHHGIQNVTEQIIVEKIQAHLKILTNEVFLDLRESTLQVTFAANQNKEDCYAIYINFSDYVKLDADKLIDKINTLDTFGKATVILNSENSTRFAVKKEHIKYIDTSDKYGYYITFLEIMQYFFPQISLSSIIEKFYKFQKEIMHKESDKVLYKKEYIGLEPLDFDIKGSEVFKVISKYPEIFTIIISLILTLATILLTIEDNVSLDQINEGFLYSNKLEEFYAELSTNNLSFQQSSKNHNIILQFESELSKLEHNEDKRNLNNNYSYINDVKLNNCLYNICAAASYYIFKGSNLLKAQKLLIQAKYIAEMRVNQGDFFNSNIPMEELHNKLSSVKNLAETYTLINYFLGRTSLLLGDSTNAQKYFLVSRFLGNKTGLFEEILSIRSGLNIIEGDKIKVSLRDKNISIVRARLVECIATYEEILNNKNEYVVSFKPNDSNYTKITPNADIHNSIDCTKRMTRLYTKLFQVVDEPDEIKRHINRLSLYLIGDGIAPGILELSTQTKYELFKISASLYNNLGYLLIELDKKGVNYTQFIYEIAKKLNLNNSNNNLELITQIFELSLSVSKNNDFTKADAYDGLAKVYELTMIKQRNITKLEKDQMLSKISEFQKARDLINTKINRIPST